MMVGRINVIIPSDKPLADLGGGCRGCTRPPQDDLQLSNTTGVYVWSPDCYAIPSGAPLLEKILHAALYLFHSHYQFGKLSTSVIQTLSLLLENKKMPQCILLSYSFVIKLIS